ncbi:uncharacterized protein L201_002446 [Kwoniella dendrophila CBS 6074]|uniref:Shugoshin C-terminal domain-containing protein n=1 Tax=Kwoniella dendrophila CBS 6074 TaxID=1295534 RepID=A0AAX4JQ73_9TREE
MAQRQGRRSLGLAPLPGISEGGTLTDTQKFEDFRRRHSKQNKEIILDNVTRKTMIKGLQDDIAKLHVELIEIRQANLILQAKLKKAQKKNRFLSQNNKNDKQIYEVLNTLILAFPALKQLRDSFNPETRQQDDVEIDTNIIPMKRNGDIILDNQVENTYATRPAEIARQNHGLCSLIETGEHASSNGSNEDDVKTIKKKLKGRHTGMGSIANSRSPKRSILSQPVIPELKPSTCVGSNSPSPSRLRSRSRSLSASPSPKKQLSKSTSSSNGKQQRKRRESGLITILARSPSPQPQPQIQENEPMIESPLVGEDMEELSEWEEGKAIEVENLSNEDIPMPQDLPSSAFTASTQSKDIELMDTIKEVNSSESGSGSSRQAESSSTALTVEKATTEEEGAVRGRRSRSSVNYKEPSLSKKMRKPDGISTEEVLASTLNNNVKPTSRKSIASGSSTAPSSSKSSVITPPKSTSSSTDSPLSPLPTDYDPSIPNHNDDIHQNGKTKTTRAALPKQTTQAMRRKSTLPKSSNKRILLGQQQQQEDDTDLINDQNDDEDDVDDLIGVDKGWEDELDDVEFKTKNLLLNSPARTTNKRSSSKAQNTNIMDETISNDQKVNSIIPNSRSSFKPTSITTTSSTNKTSSGIGLGRPIMPSLTTSTNKANGSIATTTTRNFTPTGKLLPNKSTQSDILMESDNSNLPSSLSVPLQKPQPSQTRKVSNSDKSKLTPSDPPLPISTNGLRTTKRRMSAAV